MRIGPYPTAPEPLCGVLLAVHLAAALIAGATFQVHKVTPANWVFAALGGGQTCLLGLWAGLAWRRDARRALTCVAGLAAGTAWIWALALTATQTWHRDQMSWFVARICVTVVVTTFASTMALRRYFELTRRADAPTARPPKRFQFSLRQLMFLVFSGCATLGICRALHELSGPTSDEKVVTTIYSAFMWLGSIVVLAGILVPNRLGLKWLGLPLAVFCLACLLDWLTHNQHSLAFALFAAGSSCVVVANLLAFRLAGYRLVRKVHSTAPAFARRAGLNRQNQDTRFAEWLRSQSALSEPL